MKIKELREKSVEELRQTEALYKEELFNLRMQSSTKQIEKPSRLRDLRRGIARVKTLLREEEIENPEVKPAAAKKVEKTEKPAKAEKAEKAAKKAEKVKEKKK